jgi:hypothetical protein
MKKEKYKISARLARLDSRPEICRTGLYAGFIF